MRAALVPPAALAVHQLRFVLAFGHGSGAQLAKTGHLYLHSLVPWVMLLVGLAGGGFLCSLGRAFAGQRTPSRYVTSLAWMWVACTSCLVALYVSQEFFEGLLATGHPTGWAGIFAYGGWWAIPAAAGVGLILAVVLRGAWWVLKEVARRAARSRAMRPSVVLSPLHPRDAVVPRAPALANGWSSRGPPAAGG